MNSTVSTGSNYLDQKIGEYKSGSVNILAGRPAMGKTSALIGLAFSFWKQHGFKINWLTYSNDIGTIKRRFINLTKHQNQFNSENLFSNVEKLEAVQVHEPTKQSELADWVKNCVQNDETSFICIENMPLAYAPYSEANGLAFSKVFQDLNNNITTSNSVLFISFDVKRDVDLRKGEKKPKLFDIPYFDLIARFIDKALFVYRSEYYGFDFEDEFSEAPNLLQLICAYNRSGEPIGIAGMDLMKPLLNDDEANYENNVLELATDNKLVVLNDLNTLDKKVRLDFIENANDHKAGEIVLGKEKAWEKALEMLQVSRESCWETFRINQMSDSWVRFVLQEIILTHKQGNGQMKKSTFDYWLTKIAF